MYIDVVDALCSSAGQQSHPAHVSSHPPGAHHHVSAGDGTQGHRFARGGLSRHCCVIDQGVKAVLVHFLTHLKTESTLRSNLVKQADIE